MSWVMADTTSLYRSGSRLQPCPTVLVADGLAGEGLALLHERAEVVVANGLTEQQLIARMPRFDALIVRSRARVTAKVLAAGQRLRIVGRAGTGVDNIDLAEATRRGVIVVNAATANTHAAVEHTLALILSLARHVPAAHAAVLQKQWERGEFVGVELRGKVLGIIGLGRIGSLVARRAQAFEMTVIAHDPFVSEDRARQVGVQLSGLEDLLQSADFVSVHAPLTSSTVGLLDADKLALLKPTARLINCARGGIVDEHALAAALTAGRLAGAAVDVFEAEPPRCSPLLTAPNVVLTPHLGASTQEAQRGVALDVAEQTLAALRGEYVAGAVNAPFILPDALSLLQPYLDLAERLGSFLRQVIGGRIDEVEVTLSGLLAEHDSAPFTAAALKGLIDPITDERVNIVNARHVARGRGLRVRERKESVAASSSLARSARSTNIGGADQASDYANLIELRVHSGAATRLVAGTILSDVPRIVRIDDFDIDVRPFGHLLVTTHRDRPGVIGHVGTLLGAGDINISRMQVGRHVPRGESIMVMNVDEQVPPELLAELAALSPMQSIIPVSL